MTDLPIYQFRQGILACNDVLCALYISNDTMVFIHSVLEEEIGLKKLLAGSSINFVSKVAAIKELKISKGIAGHAGNGTSGCFPTTVNPMKRRSNSG